MKGSGGKIPPKVQSLQGKVVHVTVDAAVCSPPWAWRTRCGWSFYGAGVAFKDLNTPVTCAKCGPLHEEGPNGTSRFA